MQGAIRIGVSGWRYPPWRGEFYPDGLPQHRELAYASEKLPTIEINGSFYSLQTPASYAAWHEATPSGFVFGVKGSRFITHMKRLKDIDKPLANFFASGLFNLKEKFGPILWQLPPNMKFDAERIASFIRMLPRDTQAALALARRRDARLKGRAALKIDAVRPLRHAIEIRNPTFMVPEFIELLRQNNIALVVSDGGKRWPQPHDVTADFLYLRLHGATELYRSRYSAAALRKWADRIRAWSAGDQLAEENRVMPDAKIECIAREVFCYFDNTDKLQAPINARQLMKLLDVQWNPLNAADTAVERSVAELRR
ncbi:MAG: DUF72 domain-containing protein [Burkholderiaceae bacterium]